MEMQYVNPTLIRLPEYNESVRRFLTYSDRQVMYQISKLKKNIRWRAGDPDGFTKRMDALKQEMNRCLAFPDPENPGQYCTYSGLRQDLENLMGWKTADAVRDIGQVKTIPWANKPHELRYYQKEAVEALEAIGHGGIELPTGAGKSLIIAQLCKNTPVQTVIVTPLSAITHQLYKDFVSWFGVKFVGKFGDGKKQIGKMFTLCVAHSLTRLKPGTPEWEFFSKAKTVIWDESHTTGAETFEQVCAGPLKDVPRRFFVSATQMRTDGSEQLLRGITGPIVYRKDFQELVDQGYLKRPTFKVFNVPLVGFSSSDIKTEQRNQLYLNHHVNQLAADIAQKAIKLANRQTVIIIDEFKQFMALKNYIHEPFEFVHGGANDREDASGVRLRDYLPEQYWDSDAEGAIQRFNEGKTKLLIGTSAISTGVDLRPVGCLIYLQGGLSEIKIKQAIGRGTRVVENLPKDFWVIDFKVVGSPAMTRHADQRMEIYRGMGEVTEHSVVT